MHIQKNRGIVFFALSVCFGFSSGHASAQVFANADGVTNPYSLLNSKGWYVEETTLHPGVIHISQIWDDFLQKNVFAFDMHKDIDGDSGERIDRQRLEIKTYGPSPANMKAGLGETHTYRWKFKLDAAFQPSPSFCHIHQLKAGDGDDAGSPLITITPRYASSGDKLQIIFVAPSAAGGATTYLKEVALASFKGEWVEVSEKVTFSHTGSYDVVIRRVKDDAILLEHHSAVLDLWRGTATFIRPKFGIYRSIGNLSYLRDETVRFADFSLYEGTSYTLPSAPSTLAASLLAGTQIKLAWSDNSNNEDQFRIEMSENGNTWNYLTSSASGISNCTISNLSQNKMYYFRMRAENMIGNSAYSNAVSIATTTGLAQNSGNNERFNAYYRQGEVFFSCYLQKPEKVCISLYSVAGEELLSYKESNWQGGLFYKSFKAENLPEGIYFAKLKTEYTSQTLKIFVKS